MKDTDSFGLLNAENEATIIQEFDDMIFNRKRSALTIIRAKDHLRFRTSPSKDAFRHMDFIRSKNDFKLLCLAVTAVYGLGGHIEDIQQDYFLWKFSKELNEEKPILIADYMDFVPKDDLVNLYKDYKNIAVCSFTLNLRNDNDIFQFANLFAALKNCVADKMTFDSKKERIGYRFVAI